MPNPTATTLRQQQPAGAEIDTCTVTSVSPLRITWRGATDVPATGSGIALGPAMVVSSSALATPHVLPNN